MKPVAVMMEHGNNPPFTQLGNLLAMKKKTISWLLSSRCRSPYCLCVLITYDSGPYERCNDSATPAAHFGCAVSRDTEFPCGPRSPLFTNRRANQENQSALCFYLCRKLERSRMPSSRERHSCLAMCRENGDK